MDIEETRPRPKVCSHCQSYAAQTFVEEDPVTKRVKILSTDLCGNCFLIPPEEREARKAADRARAKVLKEADSAAKKAYHDSIQQANADGVAVVTGEGDKSKRKEAAK